MSQDPHYQDPNVVNAQAVRTSNGLGIAGFVVSLVGIVSCGLISPIAFILSLIAVFKPPRGFAVAGLVIGALGSLWLGGILVIVAVVSTKSPDEIQKLVRDYGGEGGETFVQGMLTGFAVAKAEQAIRIYEQQNHELPDDEKGQALIEGIKDAEGLAIRYRRLGAGGFEVRSAGPDRQFDTADDVTKAVARDNQPDAKDKPDARDD